MARNRREMHVDTPSTHAARGEANAEKRTCGTASVVVWRWRPATLSWPSCSSWCCDVMDATDEVLSGTELWCSAMVTEGS